ncbi:LuxR C-terminal-related transcriptional regulator [Dyadobacter sp. NIV53]
MGLSINTVQEFIKRMMKKMKVNRTTDLVVLAIKTGLYVP